MSCLFAHARVSKIFPGERLIEPGTGPIVDFTTDSIPAT